MEIKTYIFNCEETGQVWSAKADSMCTAAGMIPRDAEWDDWFVLDSKDTDS